MGTFLSCLCVAPISSTESLKIKYATDSQNNRRDIPVLTQETAPPFLYSDNDSDKDSKTDDASEILTGKTVPLSEQTTQESANNSPCFQVLNFDDTKFKEITEKNLENDLNFPLEVISSYLLDVK